MKEELKKWSLFDIVGKYSSGVKMTKKVRKAPMETTPCIILKSFSYFTYYVLTITKIPLQQSSKLSKSFMFLLHFISSLLVI